MAEAINYSDTITPALINALIKGNGSGTTTTTTGGGGVDAGTLAQLQDLLAGLGGNLGKPGTVTAQGIPQVSNQITPEQLAAIFSQGAQQIPNLTAAFANAAGARSSNNSGLQLALTDLNEGLTRQAALLGQDQQKLSTDAAYKNSSLGLQAGDINARMQAAWMQAQAQLQQARAQMGLGMAGLNRQPQTQTAVTKQDGGIDPSKLMLGGFALNQASKSGWLDKIFGNDKTKQDGSGVPVVDAQADWTAPEMAATPTLDAGMNYSWELPTMDYGQNWLAPSFADNWGTIDMGSGANYGTDWGNFDLGGASDGFDYSFDAPSFDFGMDWGNWEAPSYDWSTPTYDYGAEDWYGSDWGSFFADGGQPARRNQAYMGEGGTRMLTGVGTRTGQSPGLIAPIRFAPQQQMPQMRAPQMTLYRNMQQTQQPRSMPMARQVAAPTRKELGERDTGKGGVENQPDRTVGLDNLSAVRNILGVNNTLSNFGITQNIPGIAGMLGAPSRAGVLANAGVGVLGMVNPIAGLVAGLISKAMLAEKTPKPKPKTDEVAEKPKTAPAKQVAAPTPATPAATQPGGSLVNSDAGFSSGWQGGAGYNGSSMNTNTGALGGGMSSSRDSSFNSDGSRNTSTSFGGNWGGSFGGGSFVDGGQPAPGGQIQGPGTGTSDSIAMPLANVSNGEYIVSADVVQQVGAGFFDALQAAFHKGGKPA